MYKVCYLVGGWSNFVCKSTYTFYPKKELAQKEVLELRRMGYPAMCQQTFKGGFESFDSHVFKNDTDRKIYIEQCRLEYL